MDALAVSVVSMPELPDSSQQDDVGMEAFDDETPSVIAGKETGFERKQRVLTEEISIAKWKEMIEFGFEEYASANRLRVKRRIRKGIPDCFRGYIWQLCSGSLELQSSHPPGLYQSLLQGQSKELDIIGRDINRTFPHHPLFRDRFGMGQESLMNVLKAYSLFDPEVGYCQGMGFVTAILLLHMPEEEAFWVLVSMLQSPKFQIRGLYLHGMPLVTKYLYQLDRLLGLCLPKLAKHMRHEGIHASLYASQWFITLFSSTLPFDCVLRIWDIFFNEGPKILLRVALAVMRQGAKQFLDYRFEEIVAGLKTIQSRINTNDLLRSALKIPLTHQQLGIIDQEYREQQNKKNQQKLHETVSNSLPSDS